MQTLLLHHSGPLGGILANSEQYEIVAYRTKWRLFLRTLPL